MSQHWANDCWTCHDQDRPRQRSNRPAKAHDVTSGDGGNHQRYQGSYGADPQENAEDVLFAKLSKPKIHAAFVQDYCNSKRDHRKQELPQELARMKQARERANDKSSH